MRKTTLWGIRSLTRPRTSEDYERSTSTMGSMTSPQKRTMVCSSLEGAGVAPVRVGPIAEKCDAGLIQPCRGRCEPMALQEARSSVTAHATAHGPGAARPLGRVKTPPQRRNSTLWAPR